MRSQKRHGDVIWVFVKSLWQSCVSMTSLWPSLSPSVIPWPSWEVRVWLINEKSDIVKYLHQVGWPYLNHPVTISVGWLYLNQTQTYSVSCWFYSKPHMNLNPASGRWPDFTRTRNKFIVSLGFFFGGR